jgi:O-antigen/teichoic acid export membrane protein
MMSAYRRHALISSVTSVGLYATTVVTAPVLARSLGPEGRGEVAAVMAPITVLAWLLAFGLPTAAAYFVDTEPEEQLLVSIMAFGVVVGGSVCAALWFVAPTYLAGHAPETLTWARVFLVAAPLGIGVQAALEVRRRVNPGANWNMWRASVLILPASGIVLLALAGRLSVSTALATYFAGGLIPSCLLASRLWQGRPLPRPSWATLRTMLPYAWRSASTGAATSVTNRIDQVLLVAVVTTADLGLYAVVVAVASVTNVLTSGLALALFGHLRDETSPERALSRYRKSLLTTVLLSSAAALFLATVAPFLLGLVFGADFRPAATALRLLLPGAVAYDVLVVMGTRLYSDGRPGEAALAALVGAVITVVGLFVLVPHFGIEGAAGATSLAYLGEVMFLVARGGLSGGKPGDVNDAGLPVDTLDTVFGTPTMVADPLQGGPGEPS